MRATQCDSQQRGCLRVIAGVADFLRRATQDTGEDEGEHLDGEEGESNDYNHITRRFDHVGNAIVTVGLEEGS